MVVPKSYPVQVNIAVNQRISIDKNFIAKATKLAIQQISEALDEEQRKAQYERDLCMIYRKMFECEER